ncbi:MAG: MerR family transcriptional regulator [Chloroflexi bacterium]|nr:MAG: MerR family transcriptional regulator [Chloroflexota bacterium]
MQEDFRKQDQEPCYVISVAARLVGLHAQSLRHYERIGLIEPSRSHGRQRLYSQSDVQRLRHIQRLIQDLGVNLAGVEVIIHMNERVRRMEEEMERLRAELQSYRDRVLPVVHNKEQATENWEHGEARQA